MTQEFQIKKTYQGYASKNQTVFTGTEQDCKDELQHRLSLAKRNGANVVSEDEYQFTCDDYGSNGETVQFIIE